MLSKENLFVILFSLPVYQMIFFTVQSVSFRLKTDRARVMLGLLMLSMTLVLTGNIVYYFNYYETFAVLYLFFIPLILTILPFYYIYAEILLEGIGSLNIRRLIVLLLPSVIILVLNLITWLPLTSADKIVFLSNGFRCPEGGNPGLRAAEQVFWLGNVALLGGQLALAVIRSSSTLVRARKVADLEPARLPYLKTNWMVTVFSAVISFTVIISVMNVITPDGIVAYAVYNVLVLISGGLTGYYGLRQDRLEKEVSVLASQTRKPGIINYPQSNTVADIRAGETQTENRQRKLTSNQIKVADELERLMKDEKLYLNDNLTISILSNKLGVSKRELSQIINHVKGQNFYGMINEYRIIESMDLIKDDNFRHLTIEAISEKVGFRSKSSFNACFKKVTGLTPRQYREQES